MQDIVGPKSEEEEEWLPPLQIFGAHAPSHHPLYAHVSIVVISVPFSDAAEKSVDSLSYDTLVPKSIVQRYVSLLMEHRRIILCGSSGTGKTYMAHRLAEHLILRYVKNFYKTSVKSYAIENTKKYF